MASFANVFYSFQNVRKVLQTFSLHRSFEKPFLFPKFVIRIISFDYSLNCTPLGPITIAITNKNNNITITIAITMTRMIMIMITLIIIIIIIIIISITQLVD